MSIFTRAKSIWRRSLYSSCGTHKWQELYIVVISLTLISLMTQNLLGTEGWGNYVCLSALVPSGNTPTLQPFKCNFPTHPRGSRGGGNK